MEEEEQEIPEQKPKDNLKYWALGGAIVMLFVIILALSGVDLRPRNTELTPFTNCLLEKDVKMYGAYWCSHCNAQKERFGDAWEGYAAAGGYVECDAKGKGGNPALCQERGITGFPTWHFPGENNTIQVLPGEQELSTISELSGCPLIQ